MPFTEEIPLDDGYIHFVYGTHLADTGRLFFNTPDERGVGATSLLWVWLLAGGRLLGLPIPIAAKIYGIVSLIAVGYGVFLLFCDAIGHALALLAAWLVVFSGNMLWFSLSGMETSLFLALGIWSLLAYRKGRFFTLGIGLGFLALTRPEGLLLAPSLFWADYWVKRRFLRGLLLSGLLALLVCAPWFIYLYWRTGHFIPTSGLGKQMSMDVGLHAILERNDSLKILGLFPGLLYPVVWLFYLAEFALGGVALPAPHLPIGLIVDNRSYSFSVWAVIGLALVVFPLLRSFSRYSQHSIPGLSPNFNRAPKLAFWLWVILHNLSYMVFLPFPGTSSRYGAINHVALWIALVIGLGVWCNRSRRETQQVSVWPASQFVGLASGLIVIAVASTMYWNGVYDANIDFMQNVRLRSALYLRERMPSPEKCAAFDIGVLRYFGGQPVVDLGGLLNSDLPTRFSQGKMDTYLIEQKVTCLVLPGYSSTSEKGWFDFAEELGISSSDILDLKLIQTFEISEDRWLQGYLATNNYQASVEIYRLLPTTR
ncbi:MAG TPA: hypothetical protein VI451_12855 [Anaerolineales bacterium]|nr:hypothetical protein [Anaerolineales bacterium]